MEGYFNNKSIFTLIDKWKKHLSIIIVLAIAIGVTISFMITPKFKSFAIVYPSNLATLSDESETEQMLQILQSMDIRNKIFTDFNLLEHYNISENDSEKISKLHKTFESNVSFKKTEFESVNISVLDEVPEIASNIVDSIISLYNQKVTTLHRKKYKEVLNVQNWELKRKKNEIDSLESFLADLRNKSGILNYQIQTKQITKAIAEGKNSAQNSDMIKSLKENGIQYQKTDSLLWFSLNRFNTIKTENDATLRDYNKTITYAQVVSKPFPADKKDSPVRWLIVFFTTLSALFMSIIVIGIIESKK